MKELEINKINLDELISSVSQTDLDLIDYETTIDGFQLKHFPNLNQYKAVKSILNEINNKHIELVSFTKEIEKLQNTTIYKDYEKISENINSNLFWSTPFFAFIFSFFISFVLIFKIFISFQDPLFLSLYSSELYIMMACLAFLFSIPLSLIAFYPFYLLLEHLTDNLFNTKFFLKLKKNVQNKKLEYEKVYKEFFAKYNSITINCNNLNNEINELQKKFNDLNLNHKNIFRIFDTKNNEFNILIREEISPPVIYNLDSLNDFIHSIHQIRKKFPDLQ